MNSPHTELLPREQPDGSLLSGPTGPVARAGATCSWPPRWGAGSGGSNRCLRPVNSRADEYEADPSPGGWRERGRVPARNDVFQVGRCCRPTAGACCSRRRKARILANCS